MRRYRSRDDDSARWAGFPYREGDIVISTRSESGPTWMQVICALLVFDSPVLPAPLGEISPWVDHTVEPVAGVFARLDAQQHRRCVATHTPLDGLPLDDRATYVVVARHPLDLAVSLYHQGANLDRERLADLTGVPPRGDGPRADVHDWLVAWALSTSTALEQPDSPAGVVHHVADAWQRAADGTDVVLVHYADLLADLPGQMSLLASRLGIEVGPEVGPERISERRRRRRSRRCGRAPRSSRARPARGAARHRRVLPQGAAGRRARAAVGRRASGVRRAGGAARRRRCWPGCTGRAARPSPRPSGASSASSLVPPGIAVRRGAVVGCAGLPGRDLERMRGADCRALARRQRTGVRRRVQPHLPNRAHARRGKCARTHVRKWSSQMRRTVGGR